MTNKDFIAGNDEEKISKIKSILSDRFKKASEEDLNAAADKIMSALRCTR
ncbi:hypothetical protein IJU97_03450 [bacterium]|nr:hypothetical protein [bacterium]